MKPTLISRHKSESIYSYGDWRITVVRKQSGSYPQKRVSWNSICITHSKIPGTDWGYGLLNSAIEAIDKGRTTIKV